MSKKNKKTKNKPLRNPNGFGSVYKLSGRRRRPWVAVVTTGWTENGKQLRQIVGYFETKQKGLDALALHRISPVSPKIDLTLSELYAEWSESKFKNVSRYSVNNYKTSWSYIKEYEHVKFRELRTAHWQAVIDHAAGKGLGQSALKKIRTLISELNRYAMKNDIINKNYADYIELPKFEKKERERFSDLEVKKIEAAAASNPWASTVLILIYTGMRVGELLRLTRFNVNLDRRLITGGIKTEAGKNRVIPIHPKILKYVKAWYDKGGEALICREDGSGMHPDYYRKNYYYKALDAAGVRRLVPHACRHTFASLLAEAGTDPLYIQRILGHADYAFTANEYTHPELEALHEAIKKI